MKNKEIKPIIDLLLENEGYVPFDNSKHNKLHFNMARLVKDEIRSHKWIEAEQGRELTWDESVQEWMDMHYVEFIGAIIPQKRIMEFLKKRAGECVTTLAEIEESRMRYNTFKY